MAERLENADTDAPCSKITGSLDQAFGDDSALKFDSSVETDPDKHSWFQNGFHTRPWFRKLWKENPDYRREWFRRFVDEEIDLLKPWTAVSNGQCHTSCSKPCKTCEDVAEAKAKYLAEHSQTFGEKHLLLFHLLSEEKVLAKRKKSGEGNEAAIRKEVDSAAEVSDLTGSE